MTDSLDRFYQRQAAAIAHKAAESGTVSVTLDAQGRWLVRGRGPAKPFRTYADAMFEVKRRQPLARI